MKKKLYVVTRRDLSPGAQAVQSGHALVEFGLDHLDIFEDWNETSNYLIYLAVEDEVELYALREAALYKDIFVSSFHEPDMNNSLTAVCFEPTLETAELLSGLPLALK